MDWSFVNIVLKGWMYHIKNKSSDNQIVKLFLSL